LTGQGAVPRIQARKAVLMSELTFLIGRLLFGGLFLYNGLGHFRNRQATAAYAAYKQVPYPAVATPASGLWLLASGLSVILGLRPRVGLVMIVLFLLVVTPKMHNYWTVTDPQQQMGEWVNFQKNIALVGAALMMLSLPAPWPYSLGF
jgi:putative oxidoreductase